MASDRDDRTPRVEEGEAVVPDAEDAPTKDDLLPEDPPDDAPVTGRAAQKSAVDPPVPAHGEVASREQIREATLAQEEADQDDPIGGI